MIKESSRLKSTLKKIRDQLLRSDDVIFSEIHKEIINPVSGVVHESSLFDKFLSFLNRTDLTDAHRVFLWCYFPELVIKLPMVASININSLLKNYTVVFFNKLQESFFEKKIIYLEALRALSQSCLLLSINPSEDGAQTALESAIFYNQKGLLFLKEIVSMNVFQEACQRLLEYQASQLEIHLRWHALQKSFWALRTNEMARSTLQQPWWSILKAWISTLWDGLFFNETAIQSQWLKQAFEREELFWDKFLPLRSSDPTKKQSLFYLLTEQLQTAVPNSEILACLLMVARFASYQESNKQWAQYLFSCTELYFKTQEASDKKSLMHELLQDTKEIVTCRMSLSPLNKELEIMIKYKSLHAFLTQGRIEHSEEKKLYYQSLWSNSAVKISEIKATYQMKLLEAADIYTLTQAQEYYSESIRTVIISLCKECSISLGPPPCAFTFLVVPSLAQEHLCLEFGFPGILLIEKESPSVLAYVDTWLKLLRQHLCVLNLIDDEGLLITIENRNYFTPEQAGFYVAETLYQTEKNSLYPEGKKNNRICFQTAYALVTAELLYTSCSSMRDFQNRFFLHYRGAAFNKLAQRIDKPIARQSVIFQALLDIIENERIKKEVRQRLLQDKLTLFYGSSSLIQAIKQYEDNKVFDANALLTLLSRGIYGIAVMRGVFSFFEKEKLLPSTLDVLKFFREKKTFHDSFITSLESIWFKLTKLHFSAKNQQATEKKYKQLYQLYLEPLYFFIKRNLEDIGEINSFQDIDIYLLYFEYLFKNGAFNDDSDIVALSIVNTLTTWIYQVSQYSSLNQEANCFSLFYRIPEKIRHKVIQMLEDKLKTLEKENFLNNYLRVEEILTWLNYYPNSDGLRRAQTLAESSFQKSFRRDFLVQTAEFSSQNGYFVVFGNCPFQWSKVEIEEFPLNLDVASQLFKDQDGQLQPKTSGARQHVIPIRFNDEIRYWAKFRPEQPGDEFAVEQLAWMVSGGHVPQSQIIKIILKKEGREIPGKAMAVHILSHLPGEPLTNIIDEKNQLIRIGHLEQHIKQFGDQPYIIDPQSFTEHFLRVAIIDPEDDNGNDYFVQVKRSADGKDCYHLLRGDNERAFFQMIYNSKDWFKSNILLQVKSILYCFPQMQSLPLNEFAVKLFLQIYPVKALKRWAEKLVQEHKVYQKLFENELLSHYAYQQGKKAFPSLLTIKLPDQTIIDLCDRWEMIHYELTQSVRSNSLVTGISLLETVLRPLHPYYGKLFEVYPAKNAAAIVKRFKKVTESYYQWLEATNLHLIQNGCDSQAKEIAIKDCTSGSSTPGLVAIRRSLRYETPPTEQDLKEIARGRRDCPSKALECFLNYVSPSISDLMNDLFSKIIDRENTAFRQYKFLTNASKMEVFLKYLERLQSNSESINPSVDAQKAFLNIALYLTTFSAPLDLSFFAHFLKSKRVINSFREIRQRERGNLLYSLTLQGFKTKHAFFCLKAISEACPNLKKLDLSQSFMNTITDYGFGLVEVKSFWPQLETMKMNGCHSLSDFVIEAPNLQVLLLADCPALMRVETNSSHLNYLDVSLPHSNALDVLTVHSFSKLALDRRFFSSVILINRLKLEHGDFFRQHPYLLGIAIPQDVPQKIILRLSKEIVRFLKSKDEEASRQLAFQFLFETLGKAFSFYKEIFSALFMILKSDFETPLLKEYMFNFLLHWRFRYEEVKDILCASLNNNSGNFSLKKIAVKRNILSKQAVVQSLLIIFNSQKLSHMARINAAEALVQLRCVEREVIVSFLKTLLLNIELSHNSQYRRAQKRERLTFNEQVMILFLLLCLTNQNDVRLASILSEFSQELDDFDVQTLNSQTIKDMLKLLIDSFAPNYVNKDIVSSILKLWRVDFDDSFKMTRYYSYFFEFLDIMNCFLINTVQCKGDLIQFLLTVLENEQQHALIRLNAARLLSLFGCSVKEKHIIISKSDFPLQMTYFPRKNLDTLVDPNYRKQRTGNYCDLVEYLFLSWLRDPLDRHGLAAANLLYELGHVDALFFERLFSTFRDPASSVHIKKKAASLLLRFSQADEECIRYLLSFSTHLTSNLSFLPNYIKIDPQHNERLSVKALMDYYIFSAQKFETQYQVWCYQRFLLEKCDELNSAARRKRVTFLCPFSEIDSGSSVRVSCYRNFEMKPQSLFCTQDETAEAKGIATSRTLVSSRKIYSYLFTQFEQATIESPRKAKLPNLRQSSATRRFLLTNQTSTSSSSSFIPIFWRGQLHVNTSFSSSASVEKRAENSRTSLLCQHKPSGHLCLDLLSETKLNSIGNIEKGVWAIGILRDIHDKELSNHAFFIVEFIHGGVYKVLRYDFLLNKKEEQTIKGVMGCAWIRKQVLSPEEAGTLIRYCGTDYFAYSISATQGWQLLRNIKNDMEKIKNEPSCALGYLLPGDRSIFNQFDDSKEMHNCYTYWCEKLAQVEVSGLERLYSLIDMLGSSPGKLKVNVGDGICGGVMSSLF